MLTHPNDAHAEHLLTNVALPLVADIRDDLAAAHRVVRQVDRVDLEAVACILAALVPNTIGVATLAWWRFPRAPERQALQPCGTWAAYKRHRARGQKPCAACTAASRDYRAARMRASRAKAAS